MSTYDPVSTATALAENYVYARQAQLDTSTAKVESQSSALTSLRSSLTSFTSALGSFSSNGSIIAQTTMVSKAEDITATASGTASVGTYSFYVDSLATAQQTLFKLDELQFTAASASDGASEKNLYSLPAEPKMALSVGDSGFVSINLEGADQDGDGKLSVTEIARAINTAMDGKVTAAVLTGSDGAQQLLINATSTGQANAFQVRNLNGEEVTGKMLSTAQDAQFRLGGESGEAMTSASNTYTGISGLSVEFKAKSTQPVVVTVAKDESKTKSNMQSFVNAYNTLTKAIDKLTTSGNAEAKTVAGALAGDSSVSTLRSQLNSLLRQQINGVSLTDYGISAQRDGTIALDSTRFSKKVAADPDALTSLLGQTNTTQSLRSGVLGNLQSYVDTWTKSTGGHLQLRQDSLQKQQQQFTKQQEAIDSQYASAYQRYLTQFTALSTLESQMSSTTNMLAAMFASDSDR